MLFGPGTLSQEYCYQAGQEKTHMLYLISKVPWLNIYWEWRSRSVTTFMESTSVTIWISSHLRVTGIPGHLVVLRKWQKSQNSFRLSSGGRRHLGQTSDKTNAQGYSRQSHSKGGSNYIAQKAADKGQEKPRQLKQEPLVAQVLISTLQWTRIQYLIHYWYST